MFYAITLEYVVISKVVELLIFGLNKLNTYQVSPKNGTQVNGFKIVKIVKWLTHQKSNKSIENTCYL